MLKIQFPRHRDHATASLRRSQGYCNMLKQNNETDMNAYMQNVFNVTEGGTYSNQCKLIMRCFRGVNERACTT
jgi:hypothetical protein